MIRRRWSGPWGGTGRRRPLLIAHRGLMARPVAPFGDPARRFATRLPAENTVAAFEGARAGGADGIELDVQLSRDGEVVVFHDTDLARLAGRPERVTDLAWSELAQVELEGGERIPRLADVLEATHPLLVNVEIKPPGWRRRIETVRRVLRCVERGGSDAEGRVLVSSFDPVVVAMVALTGALRTGLLFHAGQRRPLRDAWLAPAIAPYALHPEHVLVTPERIAGWHRRGYAVHPWTIHDPTRFPTADALIVEGALGAGPPSA